jgi:Protein of unknown function (DUF5672)
VSVAVAVPFHRSSLDGDEALSLRHLRAHLGRYDTYAVVPHGLALPFDLPAKRFAFTTHRDYCNLLLSPAFYEAFAHYDFVLVYQLDCLVLSDELEAWCERGFDYVGAPWVRHGPDGRPRFAGVGNGGFSLRRVETSLQVLELAERRLARARLAATLAAAAARRFVVRLPRVRTAARAALAARYRYEDKFWSDDAPRLMPGFRIPPAEVAVAFAFETEPRFCLEQNGGRLPFGVHRWAFHDRELWEPHLLPPRT